jgi:UDP-glucuronate decarboxylase
MMTCVLGARNVLEIARKTKARVVQASTSEVYGDPDVHPQPETYHGNVNPIGPRACYDEGKRAAETLFFDYRRKHDVNTGVFRIFNTYGPRMAKNDGRVVSNFIVAALADASLEIYGDGKQTRSFCYVDDLVDGIIKFANSRAIGPINLGNPGEFTVDELATIIVQKLNKGYKVYKDATADDPKQRKPDITLAKAQLNWEPKIALSEGLDKTIEYFRSV